MKPDVFYCTNAVNHAIAVEGVIGRDVRPSWRRPAIIVYDRWRLAPRPQPHVWCWHNGVNAMRALRAIAATVGFGTVYTPHHTVDRRFAPLLAAAPRVAYLDDGLDTRRTAPRNIDLGRLAPGAAYYTFDEYTELPAWLHGLDVRRCCSLAAVLRQATRPKIDLAAWDHVFIESPGLDPPSLCRARQLDPAKVLVVRHPAEHKRGPVPEGCATRVGGEFDCEGSLLAAAPKTVYCGETMSFWLLQAGGAPRHELWLQMGPAQWDSLLGIPRLRELSLAGVPGRVGVLAPA